MLPVYLNSLTSKNNVITVISAEVQETKKNKEYLLVFPLLEGTTEIINKTLHFCAGYIVVCEDPIELSEYSVFFE